MTDTSLRIDLHMHTTVSDGTDSPSEIVLRAKEAGLTLFSVTDHNAVAACDAVKEALEDDSISFINGVEFSCKDDKGRYHILGYGYDTEAAPILEAVDRAHEMRMTKVHARIDFLEEAFGFTFREEDLQELYARDNPGKPHIANLMVAYGYAKDKSEAIGEYINKKKFKDLFMGPEEAVEAILQSGGIPILAHPSYGNGEDLILGEEMEERLLHLMPMGIKGIEAFYSGFTKKMTDSLLEMAERFDLMVTAGSDYHGKNKLVRIGDTNLTEEAGNIRGLQEFLTQVRRVKR